MLRMMTAGGRSSFWDRAATSSPLNFGMAISTISRSGRYSSVSRTASRPSAASATTDRPASSSRLLKPLRTMPWSSASSTRNGQLHHGSGQREVNRQRRALASGGADGDRAVEFFDALFDSAQSETVTASPGLQPDTVIGHRHVQSVSPAGDVHLDDTCIGVPDAIRQRLLDGSVDARSIL